MRARRVVNKRVAQGLRSRGKLLRAAAERFAEHGFSATSVDAVCRDAGVVKSAIYWHFESKEGLLAAVLEETATAWIDGIVKSCAQTGDPRERLRRAIEGMRELVETRPALLRLLHAILLERTGSDPSTRAVLVRVFDHARKALADGIAEAIGTRPPGLDSVAALALASLDGIFLQYQLRQDRAELDQFFIELERVIASLVAGILQGHTAAPRDHSVAAASKHPTKEETR